MKKLFIFQSLLVICGIVCGIAAFVALPDEHVVTLHQYLTGRMEGNTMTGFLETGGQIFRSNLLDLIRVYLAGSCLLGLPVLILFIFVKGFVFGFTGCFLISYSALLILSRFLILPALVLASAAGMQFTFLMLQNRMDSPARHLLEYTITFAVILLLVLAVSYADGFMCSRYLLNYS